MLDHVAVEGIHALLIGGGAEGGHGQGLGLAAAENGGAVGAGQDAGHDLDGAHGLRVAAVDASAFLADAGPDRLLLESGDHVRHGGEGLGLVGPGGIIGEGGHDLVLDSGAGGFALELVRHAHGLTDAVFLAELGDPAEKHGIVLVRGEGHLFPAAQGDEFVLGLDEGHDLGAAPVKGVDDHVLGHDVGLAFDHGEGGAARGEDNVDVALFAFGDGGVENELAVDAAHAGADDRSVEGQRGEADGGGSACHGQNVGVVFLVSGDDRGQNLHVLLQALGEERTNRAVDEAGDEGLTLGGTSDLAAEIAAGNAAGCVHALGVFDGEGEEALVGFQSGGADGNEDNGAAALQADGAVGLIGDAAVLENEFLAGHTGGDADRVEDILEHGSPCGGRGIREKEACLPRFPGYPFARWAPGEDGRGKEKGALRPLHQHRMQLLAQAELVDEGTVALDVLGLEVIEDVAAGADELQKAGAGVEVLLVHLEVFGEAFDAGGQEGDLDFRGSGIAFVSGVFLDNYLFLSRINSHSSFSLKRV